MGKQTDIKTCRYINCKHPDKKIDITKDDYKLVGKTAYYHSDCLKEKKKGEWKDEQTKNDLQYIKNQWVLHISKTVVYSQLFSCLNELLARGVSSDYLVFVFDYIVKNNLNLRHPLGFKYFVDKPNIKDAYEKQQKAKNGIKKQSDFTADDSSDAPTFTVEKKKFGFGSVLKNKRSNNE